jgi:hypothetical protein
MVPLANLYFMFRELPVIILFIIAGVPLDITLQAITTYLFPLPVWGPAKQMSFWQASLMQAYLTFMYTPYLVMLVLAFKWRRPLVGRLSSKDKSLP